jgi:uncharacterized RmlC-like cupin family protein
MEVPGPVPTVSPSPENPQCRLVRAAGSYQGKQGLEYFSGISAESVGAQGLCLHLLVIPPGGRARAHLHANHESAIYMLEGEATVWSGDDLRTSFVGRAGDFVYIPAGVPHLPVNNSFDTACTALIARTDPNEQESVILLPELDDLPHLRGGS